MDKIKVNLHLLEVCNFRCRHCFAHFAAPRILPLQTWKDIVENCLSYAPVSEFNLAGGEPMLYPDLVELAGYIRERGCRCSIISNGICMTDEWLAQYAPLFSTIGFSIDTFEKMVELGRVDARGNTLSLDRFKYLCRVINGVAPGCKIKMNTVVSSITQAENMRKIIEDNRLPISRWKIMKMREFNDGTHSNHDIRVSDEAFWAYVARNVPELAGRREPVMRVTTDGGMEIVVEQTVVASYIIIDAAGYLLDNADTDSHRIVADLKNENFGDALGRLTLNYGLFSARYI